MKILLKDIDALVFDFDGVLTNNLVHLDHHGNEWVSCSRSDGLAFDVLRKLNMPVYILSTEKNLVVSARAKKLQASVIQGVADKVKSIKDLVDMQGYKLDNILYVGNDINDLNAMKICGFTACPSDSHSKIVAIVDIVLSSKGGQGVIRELLENELGLDFEKILYN
jgi:3-deoxy-D-manno-octulosonate 8-phosphate phosphatase (KDO 8-P phosphatase)